MMLACLTLYQHCRYLISPKVTESQFMGSSIHDGGPGVLPTGSCVACLEPGWTDGRAGSRTPQALASEAKSLTLRWGWRCKLLRPQTNRSLFGTPAASVVPAPPYVGAFWKERLRDNLLGAGKRLSLNRTLLWHDQHHSARSQAMNMTLLLPVPSVPGTITSSVLPVCARSHQR